MKPDRITFVRLALKALRALLIVAVVVAVYLLLTTRPEPPDLTAVPIASPPPQVAAVATHDLNWYAPLWERDLKQPPFPSEGAEPAAEPQESSGPVPVLLATFIDSGGNYAHLRDHKGRAQLKAIDDSIDRFRLVTIEPGRVQLARDDRSVWIEIPKPEDQGR